PILLREALEQRDLTGLEGADFVAIDPNDPEEFVVLEDRRIEECACIDQRGGPGAIRLHALVSRGLAAICDVDGLLDLGHAREIAAGGRPQRLAAPKRVR